MIMFGFVGWVGDSCLGRQDMQEPKTAPAWHPEGDVDWLRGSTQGHPAETLGTRQVVCFDGSSDLFALFIFHFTPIC